jgi:predicted secreted protein
MLQRIQSVYLFFVLLFLVLFLFFPLGSFRIDGETVSIMMTGNNLAPENFAGAYAEAFRYCLYTFLIAASIFTVYIIFQYRRRLFQIQLGKIHILLHLIILVLSFFYLDHLRASLPESSLYYGPAIFFPVISLFLILMSNRAIMKDEKLVRAAERIR